ncbi:uncharacterized protein LOC136755273 isoform X2 [Amia ocellicauda]|uniref:uncharacterized protein LOC136755273 isoform X2 n=1 Tax=Amia ocellicauda TaxID=2972642 RepID=UPI003463BB06
MESSEMNSNHKTAEWDFRKSILAPDHIKQETSEEDLENSEKNAHTQRGDRAQQCSNAAACEARLGSDQIKVEIVEWESFTIVQVGMDESAESLPGEPEGFAIELCKSEPEEPKPDVEGIEELESADVKQESCGLLHNGEEAEMHSDAFAPYSPQVSVKTEVSALHTTTCYSSTMNNVQSSKKTCNGDIVFSCCQCNRAFICAKDLTKHQECHAVTQTPYDCTQNGRTFSKEGESQHIHAGGRDPSRIAEGDIHLKRMDATYKRPAEDIVEGQPAKVSRAQEMCKLDPECFNPMEDFQFEGLIVKEVVAPDEHQPSTSSTSLAPSGLLSAAPVRPISTKRHCTRSRSALKRCSLKRSAPARRFPVRSAPGRRGQSDMATSIRTHNDADRDAPPPFPFQPRRPVGIDISAFPQSLRSNPDIQEVDIFLLFFTEPVLAEICKFTNAQGWRLVTEKISYSNQEGGWDEVTPEEFKRFLALIIYMGLVRLPDIHRYWSTAPLHHGLWARSFMSRNRYQGILNALHLVNPETENPNDRLNKVRYLLEHLKTTCVKLYQPGQNLVVDECLVKSKVPSDVKQFRKDKPSKWGFKLWALASSDSGYTIDFNIYTGNRDRKVIGLAQKVVLELVNPLEHQGYNVWLDHFYTSPRLLMELKELGCNSCGTCSPNGSTLPDVFKHFTGWDHQSNRGDIGWCRIERGDILALQWNDTRTVTCLSTFHRADKSCDVERMVKVEGQWARKMLRQPAAIHDYNQHVGGVDKSNERIGTYHALHKSKWWKTLFFHFMDIAIVNSFLLFQEWRKKNPNVVGLQRGTKFSHLKFRENLCRQLAGITPHDRVPLYEPAIKIRQLPSTFHTQHVPGYLEKHKNCWLCYRTTKKEKKTSMACFAPACNGKPLCLVRDRSCFQVWHSPEGDKYRD